MNPYYDILDSVAGEHMPDLHLYPRITAHLERKPLMQTLRARPLVALVIVILALLLLSGVAYAVGNILGYIPGVGLVDRSAPLRVLAEPVSQTREGVTITVKDALLSADKTVLSLQVEGVPNDAYPKDEASSGCIGKVDLRLADGTLLEGGYIIGGNWSAFESRLEYGPLPAQFRAAVLLVKCIGGTNPGALPEDWQIPLIFMPAPADMTVVPVIDVATPLPSATPLPAPVTQAASDPFLGVSLHVESMTRTERGYILMTSIHWDARTTISVGLNAYQSVSLKDATGKTIELLPANINTFASEGPDRTALAFSIADVPFQSPLTLSMDGVSASLAEPPRFSFAPGANPQPGQEWQVGQDIQVLGLPVRVASARFAPAEEIQRQPWARRVFPNMNGFEFTLEADPALEGLPLVVDLGVPQNADGYSGRDSAGRLTSYALLSGEIAAPLSIAGSYAEIRHPWQVTWVPAVTAAAAEPAVATTPSLSISLQIEKVIPTDDGYYLIGRTRWDDPRFSDAGVGGWDARLLAADGSEFPIEPADFNEVGIQQVEPGQWIYKVYGKAFPASVTLRMTRASVSFAQPYALTIDPGADPQIGQEWQIDQVLDILGYKAHIRSAKFIQQGDMHGFVFQLSTDPELYQVPLDIESGVSNWQGYSGGGPGPRQADGSMQVYALRDGTFGGPVVLSTRNAVFSGQWETSWNPPAAGAGATPVGMPQACVPASEWDRPTDGAATLPPGLGGKIEIERGALSPDPSQFIANLDGSAEQGLTFEQGSLSPDGLKFVYGTENGLRVLDIASRQSSTLTNGSDDWQPSWSPDGNWIVFHRRDSKGTNVFVIDARQSGSPRQLTDGLDVSIAGWTPDSQKILFMENKFSQNHMSQTVNLLARADGQIEALSLPGARDPAVSPDGQWIAYVGKVIGRMQAGIYIARLDGSGKRLIAHRDELPLFRPVWSPDGKWLVVASSRDDFLNPESSSVLIDPENCRVAPMLWLTGIVAAWLRP